MLYQAKTIPKQLEIFIETFDQTVVTDAGILITIDNASFHHKALIQMAKRLVYYPLLDDSQTQTFGSAVPVELLSAQDSNGSAARAQYYVIREDSYPGADDGRYVLLTSARMSMFQPCECLFSSLKTRMARLPSTISNSSKVQLAYAIEVQNLIKSTRKEDVSSCIRSVEHYREAWKA